MDIEKYGKRIYLTLSESVQMTLKVVIFAQNVYIENFWIKTALNHSMPQKYLIFTY